MTRSRNIKPGFFKNEDLAECSIWTRYIFPGLWMMADREGRLEDRPKRIQGELLPYDGQPVEPMLAELHAHGFIVRYEVDGVRYIQIVNFSKHQAPHHREADSDIPPPPDHDGGPPKASPRHGLNGHASGVEAQPRQGLPPPSMTTQAQPRQGLGPHATGSQAQPRHGPGTTLASPSPSDSLIPDSLIPDSSSLRSEAVSDETACRQAGDPPALALVETPKTAKTKGPPDCPHVEILALWAEVLPSMPQHAAEQWKGARADHLRARWRETAATKRWQSAGDGVAYFRKLFAYVGQSRFLTGRVQPRDPGKPPFTVTLAWLVKPENWAKTIEGTYHQDAA